MNAARVYQQLAGLFEYPGEDYQQRAASCVELLRESRPDAAPPLRNFHERIEKLSTESLQELFTQTFDLNPVCSLEVGWHLYGENYERGSFLVKMRQALRAAALPESAELPDHLTHALALLGRLEPAAGEEMAEAILRALARMRAPLEGKDNLFEPLLEGVARLLRAEYPRIQVADFQPVAELRVLDGRGP